MPPPEGVDAPPRQEDGYYGPRCQEQRQQAARAVDWILIGVSWEEQERGEGGGGGRNRAAAAEHGCRPGATGCPGARARAGMMADCTKAAAAASPALLQNSTRSWATLAQMRRLRGDKERRVGGVSPKAVKGGHFGAPSRVPHCLGLSRRSSEGHRDSSSRAARSPATCREGRGPLFQPSS